MPSSEEQNAPIEVVTWPPLWVYWPAYLALARTAKELESAGTTFKLDPLSENVTDEAIRTEFDRRRKAGKRVIALCEPRSEKYTPTAPLDPTPERIVRRLPVLWRQPHWVLKKNTSANPSPEGFIWAYPEDTTSGNFVMEVAPHLSALSDYKRGIKDLSSNLHEERDQVIGLDAEDCVVSFTPWHAVLSANKTVGPEDLTHELLSGPTRDVTAIHVPDDELHPDGDQTLTDCIGRHLRTVLDELTATQGDRKRLATFVRQDDNVELVRALLHGPGDPPFWLAEDFLVIALSEYVKLGCYFPYRALDSAISAEIQKRVGDVLTDIRKPALVEIAAAMTNFLGASPEWQSLSFQQRSSVWARAVTKDKLDLWDHLLHLEDRDARSVRSILAAIPSRTHQRAAPHPVSYLVERLPSDCIHGKGQSIRQRHCLWDAGDTGVASPDQTAGAHPSRCAFCVLAGAPAALLRSSAQKLAHLFDCPVEYRLLQTDDRSTGRTPCPIALEDVAPALKIFHEERRKTDAERPIEVVCVNGFAPGEGRTDGQVLFAILWDGELTPRGKSEGVSRKLAGWFKDQQMLGRPLSWVGTWRRVGETIDEKTAAPQDGSVLLELARSPLWTHAQTAFLSSRFVFGYVAIFDIPAFDERA